MSNKRYYLTQPVFERLRSTVRKVDRMGLPGQRFHRRRVVASGGSVPFYIAEVASNADGGGYYNCYMQSLSASLWNSDSDPFSNSATETVVVFNTAERGTSAHLLKEGNAMVCWPVSDDQGSIRYIGVEVLGRYLAGGNSSW